MGRTSSVDPTPEWDGTCGPDCRNVPFDGLTLIGCPYCPTADEAPAS